MSDERAEKAWKWLLRCLGIAGFIVLVSIWRDAPVAFYVLLGGLLGLPNIIQYQVEQNRQRADFLKRVVRPEKDRKEDG